MSSASSSDQGQAQQFCAKAFMAHLSIESGVPIYRQIVDRVKRLVASGQMVAGQPIPSVREVAKELTVHPMTVSKAYGMLESEGVLQRRRGRPMCVAPTHQAAMTIDERVELLRPLLAQAAEQSRQLGLSTSTAISLFKQISVAMERAQKSPRAAG